MITYIKGDLFNSPAQVLVNAVNTVGVMGKGVALEFKNRYPEMFSKYQKICDNGSLTTGKLCLWKGEEKWVLLFPTKQHWRNPSKIEYIEEGLKKFADRALELGIESIAFPRLGCGNGALNWEDVRPLMEKYLKPLPIRIYIYVDNFGAKINEQDNQTEMEKWMASDPELLSFATVKEDLKRAIAQNDGVFMLDGSEKHLSWEDGSLILKNGHAVPIEETKLCDFWDYIRSVGVIQSIGLPVEFQEYGTVMLQVFDKLDYLQPIIISATGEHFKKTSNGYQYIR